MAGAFGIAGKPKSVDTIYTDTPLKGGASTGEVGPEVFETFKDAQGRFRTQSLFCETPHDSYPAYFTLKKYDHIKDGKKYISLYLKYMEIADPTEYQVATRLFGSWDHWQALTRSKWFGEHLTGWREELKVKLESDRYYEMQGVATQDKGSAQAVQATKWLADRYGDKATAKRGRPSKAEKAKHLAKLKDETAELNEDIARLGL